MLCLFLNCRNLCRQSCARSKSRAVRRKPLPRKLSQSAFPVMWWSGFAADWHIRSNGREVAGPHDLPRNPRRDHWPRAASPLRLPSISGHSQRRNGAVAIGYDPPRKTQPKHVGHFGLRGSVSARLTGTIAVNVTQGMTSSEGLRYGASISIPHRYPSLTSVACGQIDGVAHVPL